MRILGIADVDYVHTRRWARYLSSRGHEVRVVSFCAATGAADYPKGVVIEPWHLPPFHLKRFWLTLRAIRRLQKAVALFRPHLTQVHFLGSGAWYAALAGLRPLSLWIMGGDITGASWKPASRREALLSRVTLRRADLVLSWSAHLRGLVAPFLRAGVPSEVVVGGVDVDVFRPCEDRATMRAALGLPPRGFLVLSPRLVWPLYNIDVIVAALPHVRRALPESRLVIIRHTAGRYEDYLRAVERQVGETGQAESVLMMPPLEHAQIARYFAAVDCTVSIPDTDGTPMAVLESLSSGTPAIVHDLAQYDQELFAHEETVLRVPLRDPLALAQAILRLAQEPALRSSLAQRGRDRVVKRASYEGEMGRLEELYLRLVNEGGA